MFGSSKKRFASLRQWLSAAESLNGDGRDPNADAIRAITEQLGPAIDDVRANDYNEVLHDPELEAVFDRASQLQAQLLAQIESKVRAARRKDDARQAPVLIQKLRLRRCVQCEGTSFFVRENFWFEGSTVNVQLSMVVCAGCGDVRLVVPDAKALDALKDDHAYVFVELPQSGPFR
ncbi:MAG: hypothetical protein U0269_31805 [Polyangiales bacterium]